MIWPENTQELLLPATSPLHLQSKECYWRNLSISPHRCCRMYGVPPAVCAHHSSICNPFCFQLFIVLCILDTRLHQQTLFQVFNFLGWDYQVDRASDLWICSKQYSHWFFRIPDHVLIELAFMMKFNLKSTYIEDLEDLHKWREGKKQSHKSATCDHASHSCLRLPPWS